MPEDVSELPQSTKERAEKGVISDQSHPTLELTTYAASSCLPQKNHHQIRKIWECPSSDLKVEGEFQKQHRWLLKNFLHL